MEEHVYVDVNTCTILCQSGIKYLCLMVLEGTSDYGVLYTSFMYFISARYSGVTGALRGFRLATTEATIGKFRCQSTIEDRQGNLKPFRHCKEGKSCLFRISLTKISDLLILVELKFNNCNILSNHQYTEYIQRLTSRDFVF